MDLRAVVLVEGISDKAALETLAELHGRDLEAEGVSVVPIGGAQAIRRFVDQFGPGGLGVTVAGLCDAGEEADFRRALVQAGLGSDLTRTEMETLGFYVCVADLEDELIRAHGTESVERVVESEGDLRAFRTPSRSNLGGREGGPRSSSGASWEAAAGGRFATRRCSSQSWISPECRDRSSLF